MCSKLHAEAHVQDAAAHEAQQEEEPEIEGEDQVEVKDLREQLDHARLLISQLAAQADHDRAMHKALTGQPLFWSMQPGLM